MLTSTRQLFAARGLMMVVALASAACEQRHAESHPPATSPAAEAHAPVLWQRVKDATVIAVNDADMQSQLAQAMADARRSADDARQRWSLAKPEERALWAVKWAAPLAASANSGADSRALATASAPPAPAGGADASDDPLAARRAPTTTSPTTTPDRTQPLSDAEQPVEHVWVQPINWSPFRIEGVLLSDPVHELDCGRINGEIVSFPTDQLSDWIHFATDPATNPDTPFEGGFTVKVLEERYGRP